MSPIVFFSHLCPERVPPLLQAMFEGGPPLHSLARSLARSAGPPPPQTLLVSGSSPLLVGGGVKKNRWGDTSEIAYHTNTGNCLIAIIFFSFKKETKQKPTKLNQIKFYFSCCVNIKRRNKISRRECKKHILNNYNIIRSEKKRFVVTEFYSCRLSNRYRTYL